MENALPVAPVERLVGRFVACCTVAGELHLFESKEEFVSFTRSNSSRTGLVMAWIDCVIAHRETLGGDAIDVECRHDWERTFDSGTLVCRKCGGWK